MKTLAATARASAPETPKKQQLDQADDGAPEAAEVIDAGNVIGRRFKATGYPCLIVIDGKGVISHVVSGNKKNIVEDVSEKLNALVAAEGQG